jgi:hypothetical protein
MPKKKPSSGSAGVPRAASEASKRDDFLMLYEQFVDERRRKRQEDQRRLQAGVANDPKGPNFQPSPSMSGGQLFDPARFLPKSGAPVEGDIWINPVTGESRIFHGDSWLIMVAGSEDLDEDERRYLRESLGLSDEVEL